MKFHHNKFRNATTKELTMKSQLRVLVMTAGLFCAATGFAQTAAPAAKPSPSPSTPMTAPMTTAVTPSATTSALPATKAPMTKKEAKTAMPTTAAAGGGAGKVWVNTKSKTYHCEGTKFYGTTKGGNYMTEADAKAAGNHADHGKACVK